MNICDKFDFKSKQKMKKMIELSYEDGCEYFAIIKKNFTLGEISKGEEDAFYPNELINTTVLPNAKIYQGIHLKVFVSP